MQVVVTAAASGRDKGRNPSINAVAGRSWRYDSRAPRTTIVPPSRARLSSEKNSWKTVLSIALQCTKAPDEPVGAAGNGQNVGVTLKERLKADLTEAMKAKDEAVRDTLRMVLAAISNAEVAGDEAVVLTDDQALAVVRSEAKKRQEAAQIYRDAGRTELADKETAELAVIERYLPAAMSDDDLAKVVAEEVAKAASTGATGGKAMGAVVKAVRERVGSQADGSKIAALVKAALG